MSNLETNGSPQLEVIHSYIQELEKRDVDRAGKALHKDYCRLTYPKSVGKPAQTKEEHLQFIGGIANPLNEDCEVNYVCGCSIFLTLAKSVPIGVNPFCH